MPSFCAAVGCSNSSWKLVCQEKKVSFHKFPLKNKELLKIWLLKIKREGFYPNQYSQLCSEHFEETFFTYQPFSKKRLLVQNAVPTKFKHNKSTSMQKHSSYQFHNPVSEYVSPWKIQLNDSRTKMNDAPVLLCAYSNISKEFKCDEGTTKFVNHNIESNHTLSSPSSSRVSISDDSEIHDQNENDDTSLSSNLEFELKFLKKSVSTGAFKVEMITDDYAMYSVTGFNVKTFHAIFKLLSLKDLLQKGKLSPLDQFFLMIVYLKTGINQLYLSFLYKIEVSSVSRTIVSTTNIVYKKLREFDIWPSQEAVRKKTPLSFSQIFPNCRIIIDCVEFNVRMPNSPLAQEETLNRKCTYTIKGMIGITPSRTVSFISDLVGGSMSDKKLFLSSGLLDLLQPGDLVIADKGFGLVTELAERGCELAMLHSSKCSSGETYKEEALSFIENVISRIRTYKYFNNKTYRYFSNQFVNHGLEHLNKYFFIVAFFLNFANPFVPEDV